VRRLGVMGTVSWGLPSGPWWKREEEEEEEEEEGW